MAYEIPGFLKRKEDALLYNGEGHLEFYLPEEFFDSEKIAVTIGAYISMLGICNYALFDKNDKQRGELKSFHFPTMMLCKPSEVVKVKNLKLSKNTEAMDYRVLKFYDGDEVVTSVKVPQIVDNAEVFFSLFIITGKIPTTIPYDELHNYFKENANLNGFDYGMNMQMFGLIMSKICRDPSDLSRPFRLTDMKNMNGYTPISIKRAPDYVSPYVAITSENFDESLMAAIVSKEDKYSPLERVLTM